jgi:hypothetical protein
VTAHSVMDSLSPKQQSQHLASTSNLKDFLFDASHFSTGVLRGAPSLRAALAFAMRSECGRKVWLLSCSIIIDTLQRLVVRRVCLRTERVLI